MATNFPGKEKKTKKRYSTKNKKKTPKKNGFKTRQFLNFQMFVEEKVVGHSNFRAQSHPVSEAEAVELEPILFAMKTRAFS